MTENNKWNYLRLIGLLVAVVLIIFGGLGNFLRSIRYGLGRLIRE